MSNEIKVPAVGESITEAIIGSWQKKNGDFVKRNEVLLLLETDKASVEVVAENDGVLSILPGAEAGKTVQIGAVIGNLAPGSASAAPAAPGASATSAAPAPTSKPTPPPPPPALTKASTESLPLSPAVAKLVADLNVPTETVAGTGKDGRLTKGDVLAAAAHRSGETGTATSAAVTAPTASATQAVANSATKSAPALAVPGQKRLVPMTTIRKKIAEKLKEAQNTAALLTTFNEIDMGRVSELRAKYKDAYKEKHGVNLGFNGFFVKAVIEALKAYPAVNAWIVGQDIEYHDYYNIGIAVSTEKGLMVPVVKNADTLSMAQIELAIKDLALKGRDGKISVNDLSGGTFSITNGGVFGSLMSTPILNAPQSAILGLHKIQDRPMAINGQVVIRPMMYVALTYDHRIIDGKEAVSFLVKVKELIEEPERLLLEI